jgi:hypothetical protein
MDLAKGGTLPSELKACNTSQKSVTRLVLICPLTSRIKIIYGCIVILRTNILIGRVMRSLHVSILDSSNIMLIIEWNVEYSTEIDDSIPCQRSRIFHPKLVEYANYRPLCFKTCRVCRERDPALKEATRNSAASI